MILKFSIFSITCSLAQSDLTKGPIDENSVRMSIGMSIVKLQKSGIDKRSLEELSKSRDFFFRISATGPEGYSQSVVSKVTRNDVVAKWTTYSYDDIPRGIIHNITEVHEVKDEDIKKISELIETSILWKLGDQDRSEPVLTGVSGVSIEMSHKGKYKRLYYFQPENSNKKNDKIFVNEVQKILKNLNLDVARYLFSLEDKELK